MDGDELVGRIEGRQDIITYLDEVEEDRAFTEEIIKWITELPQERHQRLIDSLPE